MIEQYRGENTFQDAIGWGQVSLATKFIALTAFVLPAYGIYEKGIAYPVNLSPETTRNEMVFGFAAGTTLLALSLPADVISGAKFVAFTRKSAQVGIFKMVNFITTNRDETKWVI